MLTAEQIAQFHRDGFLIMRGMVKGRELAELRKAGDAVVAEAVAGKGQHHFYHDHKDGRRVYFRSHKMWDRADIFRGATVNPAILECMAQCFGHPYLPINDVLVCKLPQGDVPIKWHQDPPYSSPDTRETFDVPNFDTDIYLDPSTIENGCVWGIPGHHLVGHVDFQNFSQEELFEKFGAVPMIMEPGDVLFHCISGPHGSIGNKTNDIRRIFYVHYMPQEVVEARNKPGGGKSPQTLAQVRDMIDTRKRMGFDGLEGRKVKLADEGFVLTDGPGTPPRHWRTLIDAIPEEEKNRLRRLETARAAVGAGGKI